MFTEKILKGLARPGLIWEFVVQRIVRWVSIRLSILAEHRLTGWGIPSTNPWKTGQFEKVMLVRAHPENNRLDQDTPSSQPPVNPDIPDLHALAITWLEDSLNCQVNEVTFSELMILEGFRHESTLLCLVVMPSPRRISWFRYILRLRKLAARLKAIGVNVVCILPDTFYPDTIVVCRIFLTRLVGKTIFLQSTSEEASQLGFSNPVDRVFWTWPESRLSRFLPAAEWNSRQDLVVLPSDTGDQRRQRLRGDLLKAISLTEKWRTSVDGQRSLSEYIALLKSAKICVTTNWVQTQFKSGPAYFVRRVPETHTTGRVWESFAASTALVTQRTQVLDKLGFIPQIHYFDLQCATDFSTIILSLPDEEIEKVAKRGHSHFLSVLRQFSDREIGTIFD